MTPIMFLLLRVRQRTLEMEENPFLNALGVLNETHHCVVRSRFALSRIPIPTTSLTGDHNYFGI
ncbi:MAG: hypothetical protein DKT66_09720 [Candidatus Melainabacteria bacterium]|nr:MAG: hypothetical protein DKT66_09720 [Candidatus Melainabacteria bacterium]